MAKTHHISLSYGSDHIQVKIPDNNLGYFSGNSEKTSTADNQSQLNIALDNRVNSDLHSLVKNRSVVCLIYDASRKVPQNDFLNTVFPYLRSSSSVTVILATGTHDGNTPGNETIISEMKAAARRHKISLVKVEIHNCHDVDIYCAGRTKTHKTEVYVNRLLENAEVFLVYSDMKNHYFAGYSNGIKNFFPGVAKYESVEKNHSLAMNTKSTFGFHPLHPDPDRRNNPIARDMWEAYNLIIKQRPVFVVATITIGMKIIWAKAGLLEDVIPAGITKVDELMSVHVVPQDKLIVSCGGFPNDESLYMAQRALELSRAAVKKGGEVLLLAECRNGIGPQKSIENFYQPLTQSPDKILQKFASQKYIMYAHKSYKFALMINELKAVNLFSAMADEIISRIHLTPVADVQETIDNWISADPLVKINIVSEGSKIAVHGLRL